MLNFILGIFKVPEELRSAVADPTPVEQTISRRPAVNSLRDLRELQYALDYQARLAGKETFEEANDFDVPDGYDDLPLAPAQLRAQAVEDALAARLINTAPKREAPITREQVEKMMAAEIQKRQDAVKENVDAEAKN